MNFLSNALKFTNKNGTVSVRISLIQSQPIAKVNYKKSISKIFEEKMKNVDFKKASSKSIGLF